MKLHGGYEGFDWDEGNATKNMEKHQIGMEECEEVFSNRPFFFGDDLKHSFDEKRLIIFGQTDNGKRFIYGKK